MSMNYDVRPVPPKVKWARGDNWVDVEVGPGAASTPLFTFQVEENFWNRWDRRRVGDLKWTIVPPERPI